MDRCVVQVNLTHRKVENDDYVHLDFGQADAMVDYLILEMSHHSLKP